MSDKLQDVRDYEIYFTEAFARRTERNEAKDVISAVGEAFARSAAQTEEVPPFDASPWRTYYSQWNQILTKFSLLFHGFGSKRELLHDFGAFCLRNYGYVVEVDAFSGQSRLLQNAMSLLYEFLAGESTGEVSRVISALENRKERAFVIFHSIDSDFIKDEEIQQSLAMLSSASCVSVIASIDRIPEFELSFYTSMKFYPIEVRTNRPYTQEVGLSGSSGSGPAVDSIERFAVVLATLTVTANGIFNVLLKHQIKTGDGMTRSEWADKATSALCMRMHTTFPTQLNEFLDHRLIVEKKESTICYIPLNPVQLEALQIRLNENQKQI